VWIVLLFALAPAVRADDGRGEELFALCAACHGADGGGNPMTLAPSIGGLEQWYVEAQLRKFRDGVRGTHFDDQAGMRMRPMARWLKTDEDVSAVAAFVAALPPPQPAPVLQGGDPARGATLYATCSACHGVQGEGNPSLSSPSLRHTSDWYLFTQLKNFKQGIRGAHPKDATGALMRPMAMLLPDDQAMRDVIAHIGSAGN
jgi:cytochrome c553